MKNEKKYLIDCKSPCWCSYCKNTIFKSETYLKIVRASYKGMPVRINICMLCLKKMSKEIKPSEFKNKLARETEKKI